MELGTSSRNDVGAATSERLVRVAAELFRAKGYASTTTREISDELGIQKGSLYHHIKTKEDLLHWICIESLNTMTARVEAALVETPPGGRLRALIAAQVNAELEDQDLHTVMLVELRSLSEDRQRDVIERRDAYYRMVQDEIRAEQKAGLLRADIKPRHLTLALEGLLHWAIFWYRDAGTLGSADVGGFLADIFIDGAANGP